jgi:hypothetical protein
VNRRVSDERAAYLNDIVETVGKSGIVRPVADLLADRADYEREIKELRAALELALSGDIHDECLPVLGECMYGSQRCTEVSAVIRAARLLEAK